MTECSSFKSGAQAPVYISITEPQNPKPNYLWFNPVTKELRVRQGLVWELVSTSAVPIPAPATVSVSPPPGAEEGALWFDPITGILSVWYTDLDGGQWLATVPYALLEAADLAAASAEQAAQSAAQAEEAVQQIGEFFSEVLIDSSQTGIIYVGEAPQGSSESSPVWVIRKSVFSSSGLLLSKQIATDVAWEDRYIIPYT